MKVKYWPDAPEECSNIEPPGMNFGEAGVALVNVPLDAVDIGDLKTGTAPCS